MRFPPFPAIQATRLLTITSVSLMNLTVHASFYWTHNRSMMLFIFGAAAPVVIDTRL